MKPKHVKRNEAKERQEKYSSLTVEQKIAMCKHKPGNCERELKKLEQEKEKK